jgi:hypothetical protein
MRNKLWSSAVQQVTVATDNIQFKEAIRKDFEYFHNKETMFEEIDVLTLI